MMNALFNNFQYLIQILVVIGILEIIASSLWWKFYFNFGLPIYTKRIKTTKDKIQLLSAQVLEDALPQLAWRPPLLVRQIDSMSFAFREKIFFIGFSYVPVMHGYMNYDPDKNEIVISGFANWYAFVFAIFFILLTTAFMPESKELKFLILLAGLCLIMGNGYLSQRRRFNQLTETVQMTLNKT